MGRSVQSTPQQGNADRASRRDNFPDWLAPGEVEGTGGNPKGQTIAVGGRRNFGAGVGSIRLHGKSR